MSGKKQTYLPADGKKRCRWVQGGNRLYYDYHDREWGVPVRDDRTLFEFLILEGAQAGLSWATVLNKRQEYRRAFANFNPRRVAKFSDADIHELLDNAGLIRNRLKMRAAIINANCFLETAKEFGNFSCYVWGFVGNKPIQGKNPTTTVTSPESDALSADLKKRGFKFVGSTIMYAYMQAVGLVQDHEPHCFRYHECKKECKKLQQ